MRFSTPEIADIFDQVRPYGHPENPFLARRYSTGGYYPVTDFTQTVAGWLAKGRIEAVRELWSRITAGTTTDFAMLRMAVAAEPPQEFGFDEDSEMEIKAVHLLGSRLSVYETVQSNVVFEMARVLATRLASIYWKCPLQLIPVLRGAADSEIEVIPGFTRTGYKERTLDRAMAASSSLPDEAVRIVGEWMIRIPPMARLVVAEYFHRTDGRLHPELYYEDRKYGCNAEINLRFIDWISCFEPPPDDAKIPMALTKQMLFAALKRAGVTVSKSSSKADLVNRARLISGLISSVFCECLKEYCIPKAEWNGALEKWADRWDALQPIAVAILKPMALQSMLQGLSA